MAEEKDEGTLLDVLADLLHEVDGRNNNVVLFEDDEYIVTTFEARNTTSNRAYNRYRINIYHKIRDENGNIKLELANREPFIRLVQEVTERHLPRYLFRVYSKESAGRNGPGGFQSHAMRHMGAAVFDDMTEAYVRDNLRLHSTWGKGSKVNPFQSHWISTTSSPLFAFQHAVRKLHLREQGICMCVIDTHKLKKKVLIFNAFQLLRAHNIESKTIKSNSYAEFLIWDEIVADVDVVPIQDLIQIHNAYHQQFRPGLFDLVTDFDLSKVAASTRHHLKARIDVLRYKLYDYSHDQEFELEAIKHFNPKTYYQKHYASRTFHGKSFGQRLHQVYGNERMPMSPEIIQAFYGLACCFREDLRFPMLVAFLSMRTRYLYEEDIVDAVSQLFKGSSIVQNYAFCSTGRDTPLIPELQKFQELMTKCCARLGLRTYVGQNRPARKLAETTYRKRNIPQIGTGIVASKEEADNIFTIMWNSIPSHRDGQGVIPLALERHLAARASSSASKQTPTAVYGPRAGPINVNDFIVAEDGVAGVDREDIAESAPRGRPKLDTESILIGGEMVEVIIL